MNKLLKITLLSIVSMTMAYTAKANETHHNIHGETHHIQTDAQMKEPLYQTTGVIKGIDNKQQKISISHEKEYTFAVAILIEKK